MALIEDISDTRCVAGCCKVHGFPGMCGQQWTCQHHARDFDTARARMADESLRTDLRLQLRGAGDPLSDEERSDIEGLRGVETAKVVAARYAVAESTIRGVWARQNKRLRKGETPAPALGEAAELVSRIQQATGWSHDELARQSGVAIRTLYRLRTGEYRSVSKKVMAALEHLALRESVYVA